MTRSGSPVALVTGAARRLGRVFATHLAGRGFDLGLHCHTSVGMANELAASLRASGRRACVVTADQRDAMAVAAAVNTVHGEFGRLDVGVISASAFPKDTVSDLDAASFADTLMVNTVGPFIFARECARRFQHGGRLVILGDIHGEKPLAGHIAYSASKAALHSVVRSLARTLAPRGIAVNAILPGAVLPPQDFDPNLLELIRARTPTGRLGTPSDLVAVLDFLMDAPLQITGQFIAVDGGRSI